MLLSRALENMRSRFGRAGIADARAEAEFLAAAVLGIARLEVRLQADRPLTCLQTRRLSRLLRKRLRREPLAYVLGCQPFLDLNLKLRPGVFIPRPETEELTLAAVELARRMPAPRGPILDLGTGSGAIAISMAKRLQEARVVATDCSLRALEVARCNACLHGVAARIQFRRGDLFEALRPKEAFDIIVSNPPYVRTAALAGLAPEVRREGRQALDGGPDGLRVLRRIVEGAPLRLRPGGWLVLEMDPAQTRTVAAWLRRAGFSSVEVLRDLQGRDRIVMGRLATEVIGES